MPTDEELMMLARTRAQEKLGFYIHFSVYVIINAFLILIWWFVAGDGFPWFLFILAFWGVGIVAHFIGTFAGTERMTQREYERLKQEKR